eukprot:NODE_17797_length_925_cov_6.174185.p2 GENE.NODE_17797_length_925_cov_6.174185~~NODE_17797_length_925_cov_6.174185.p2  ORF type:complete len:196 (-),score=47.05 NODE_17797_length_925_cov_6.174185:336-860(-)
MAKDTFEMSGPRGIVQAEAHNEARVWCLGRASLALNALVAVAVVPSLLADVIGISPDPAILRTLRLLRLLPFFDLWIIVAALYTLQRTAGVPRGFLCAGIAVVPWTFMIVAVAAVVHVGFTFYSGAVLGTLDLGNPLVAIDVLIHALDGLLLAIFARTWIRRIKEEGVAYAAMP